MEKFQEGLFLLRRNNPKSIIKLLLKDDNLNPRAERFSRFEINVAVDASLEVKTTEGWGHMCILSDQKGTVVSVSGKIAKQLFCRCTEIQKQKNDNIDTSSI